MSVVEAAPPDQTAEGKAAKKQAEAEVAFYEEVRGRFIEQVIAIDLISECRDARKSAKLACARARSFGPEYAVRTPDSVAWLLSRKNDSTDPGRDAITKIQRELASEL